MIEDALREVRERVAGGHADRAAAVDRTRCSRRWSRRWSASARRSGELEKMLGKIADFYEDEVDAAVAALTSIIEPLMMIGVGMMVGMILIAMYMPMFKMLQAVK